MKRFREKPECGTLSGYDWHTRQAEETPCVLCREAASAHWRKKRQSRGPEINALRRKWRIANNRSTKINWASRIDEIVALYGTECHLCNSEIDFEAPRKVGERGWELAFHPDHVVSLSRGGQDDIENIRPSHAYCNQTKWASL